MLPTKQGALPLFRFAGIQVYLHWSWFVAAWYSVNMRANHYPTLTWNALEYVCLFALVVMHEFGHALACRQVGGQAHEIILWPFGGVAFVSPPQRPGAVLWSIAAGPLVNAVLYPVFYFAVSIAQSSGWAGREPEAFLLLKSVAEINLVLLIFNMLPVFPLDGGQIVRALLWFKLGPVRSLLMAAAVGFVGVAALLALAIRLRSYWIAFIAIFIYSNCQRSWSAARAMQRAQKARVSSSSY